MYFIMTVRNMQNGNQVGFSGPFSEERDARDVMVDVMKLPNTLETQMFTEGQFLDLARGDRKIKQPEILSAANRLAVSLGMEVTPR